MPAPSPLAQAADAVSRCKRELVAAQEAAGVDEVTVNAIQSVLDALHDYSPEIYCEMERREAEEHATEIAREIRDERAYEASVRSLVGQV